MHGILLVRIVLFISPNGACFNGLLPVTRVMFRPVASLYFLSKDEFLELFYDQSRLTTTLPCCFPPRMRLISASSPSRETSR